MNILIISRTPWSNSNSFGNTFTNLFQNMPDVEIYHICCQKGETRGTLATHTLQMTDSSVFYSFFGKDASFSVNNEYSSTRNDISEFVKNRQAKSNVLFHILRDIIWRIGNWKKSRNLNLFLENANIDLLYLPIYASCYMCDVQLNIINRLKVPVIAHITDDVYREHGQAFPGVFGYYYQRELQKKLRNLISKCEYIDVFAEKAVKEYERLFKKECFVIGKGIHIKDVPINKELQYSKANTIVYTGGLGTGRYKVIAELARAIDKTCAPYMIIIYSPDHVEGEIQHAFDGCRCIDYRGKVDAEKARKAQKDADYLLHVESFDKRMIETTKLSFSTKIIDYMMTGNPIIAIGPSEVNSISILKEKHLAIVADSYNEIVSIIEDLEDSSVKTEDILENVRNYLINDRNIELIQNDMLKRMKYVCSRHST